MAFMFTFKRRLKIKFDFGGAGGIQRGAGVSPLLAAVASATNIVNIYNDCLRIFRLQGLRIRSCTLPINLKSLLDLLKTGF